jgi:uncharacterized protein
MQATQAFFDTDDHLRLEGRLAVPEEPTAGVVLCHPHPLYQGSMSSAMIPALQRGLFAAGLVALRFNFRGVGRSEGAFDGGRGEVRDALAAIEFVRARVPQVPLSVVGWSFGALVALSAAVTAQRVQRYVAIAPPVSWSVSGELPVPPAPERVAAWHGDVLGICGTEDPFCRPRKLEQWVKALSATGQVRVFEGEDHFFTAGRDELTTTVTGFLT